MSVSLVIMAAGIGSRFGGGIKQLTPVGPNGELIIDYSIHDALEAGFDKVVFIIRKDLEKDFREMIGERIEKVCKVEYVFQELDMLPDGFEKPADRTKPWGTGQAVLCCKSVLKEPFAVINADDYYGKEAFQKVYQFLCGHDDTEHQYCMAGFILDNTLSDNGTVTRGICQVNGSENLVCIDETKGIQRDLDGRIKDADDRVIPDGTHVSMNMWGLTSEFLDILEDGFAAFLSGLSKEDLKAEYLLPIIIGDLLREQKVSVKVLETPDKWFGVTYQEDKQTVMEAFCDLIRQGVYKTPLF